MFTGIIEEVGVVRAATDSGGDLRVRIEADEVLRDLRIGDSVAISGCCLTAVSVEGNAFEVELSKETVAKTAPRWRAGSRVNLERALPSTGRFGGHVVSGHVEGVGTVLARSEGPGAFVLTLRAPERLARYLIPKGSVAVDGVSLTVVDVGGPAGSDPALPATDFTLWLIPHTLDVTTLGELGPGSAVNLEADVLARYAERLLAFAAAGEDAGAPEGAVVSAGPGRAG
ncbi:MAG: riboflavin synthase [Deinococcales bacterium]